MLKLTAQLKEPIRVELRGNRNVGQTLIAAEGILARSCELVWRLRLQVLMDALTELVLRVAHPELLCENLVSLAPG